MVFIYYKIISTIILKKAICKVVKRSIFIKDILVELSTKIHNFYEDEEWVKECVYCRKSVKESDWIEVKDGHESFKISCIDCADS